MKNWRPREGALQHMQPTTLTNAFIEKLEYDDGPGVGRTRAVERPTKPIISFENQGGW